MAQPQAIAFDREEWRSPEYPKGFDSRIHITLPQKQKSIDVNANTITPSKYYFGNLGKWAKIWYRLTR